MDRPALAIRLRIDPKRLRRWHLALGEALEARGHRVGFEIRQDAAPLAPSLGALLAFERVVGQWRGDGLGAPAAFGREAPPDLDRATLTIDLTGAGRSIEGRWLRPVFGAADGEDAAIAALLDGERPTLGVRDSLAPDAPTSVRVAIDDPSLMGRSLDQIGARLVRLLSDAADAVAAGRTTRGGADGPARASTIGTGAGFGRIAAKAAAALTRRLTRPSTWRVGWRRAEADRVWATGSIDGAAWTPVKDDGARYYADPFAIAREGRHWIFVEELPYATGRGIISALPVGPDGPEGPARPVIEEPHHLSYPFLVEERGELWMIPESSAARRVDLYRCVEFPTRWERAATLIDGIDVGDATLARRDGRWWMVGTVSHGGSSWDVLHLWSAPELAGPWTAVGDGPVLIDATCARPAGAFFERDGALWRSAQDCSTGYGAGVTLARVTRMDSGGFAQEVATVLKPRASWAREGFHTLNWAGGLEVVDGLGRL